MLFFLGGTTGTPVKGSGWSLGSSWCTPPQWEKSSGHIFEESKVWPERHTHFRARGQEKDHAVRDRTKGRNQAERG